ncbi:membrane protein [Mycobacterium phage Quesadilla]|uniref:Membrane protein n=1 Tax=Mycobacterium phage Quesadilla TaxID=2664226 RepID=A0A5Q2W9Z0_9CAUD|nr:membrane protein [Mycobacterium phage Quesadilla]QGH75341.1 membrane protein [Mycobacterium phage Quesadilla]
MILDGPITLLLISLLACVWLHFTRRGGVAELAAATMVIAPVLAIPVGYLLGTF